MPIDLSKYDPTRLSRSDVKSLVEAMYTTLDANERIRDLFHNANPDYVMPLLERVSEDQDPETACNAVEILIFLAKTKAIGWVARLLNNEDEAVRGAACGFLAQLPFPESISNLAIKTKTEFHDR